MKSKSEFICIEPKTEDSKFMFETTFKNLHSCKVIKKLDHSMYVKSIAGDFYFWIHKDDKNWNLIK